MEKVEQWRRALTDVADLGGMVLGQRYVISFISFLEICSLVSEVEK
jgi:hypothetical protein